MTCTLIIEGGRKAGRFAGGPWRFGEAAASPRLVHCFPPGLFDLLLCDLSLPDGDGCDLVRELKHRCGLSGVALTEATLAADQELALDSGFAVNVPKPVCSEELWNAVGIALQARAIIRGQQSGPSPA